MILWTSFIKDFRLNSSIGNIYFRRFNYSDLKIEKVLINSGIVLKDNSKIDYNIFPSPRLSIKNVKISFDNELIDTNSSEILLVLNFKEEIKHECKNS